MYFIEKSKSLDFGEVPISFIGKNPNEPISETNPAKDSTLFSFIHEIVGVLIGDDEPMYVDGEPLKLSTLRRILLDV